MNIKEYVGLNMCLSVLYIPLTPYSTSNISMTLKFGLGSFKVNKNGCD